MRTGRRDSPYSLAHCDARNQSSCAVRLVMLPTTGSGFGPGGIAVAFFLLLFS